MRLAGAALATLVALGAGAPQDEETQVDKYLRVAREGSPVVRPQAAQRLVGLGEEASARVLELAPDDASLARLGQDVLEVLGELPGAELRARLWGALDDKEFPWRPSAARTLAKTAVEAEGERFAALLGDHVSAVRTAAVTAHERLAPTPTRLAAVEELLADPHDRVRRAAASRLASWGRPCALLWIVEDLKRTDRFFDVDTGTTARFEAIRVVERHLGERFGFAPEQPPGTPENAAAIDAIAARVRVDCTEAVEMPGVARAGGTDVDAAAVLGLEIRSCRRGEFFLRWTEEDELLVGTGNPARLALPEGTVARLVARSAAHVAALEGETFWGAAGCDSEVIRLRAGPQEPPRILRTSKGPDAVEGLRPAPLSALAADLVDSIPIGLRAGGVPAGGDPRLERLRSRVRAALLAVGGELEAD